MTHGRAEIHELLVANDLRPSRALGQNFVADGNTVRRIVRLADIAPGRRVVEVGAGLGSLTLALAEAGASVTAVEIDRYVLPVLRSQVEPLGVRVVEGDALRLLGRAAGWSPAGGGPADDRPWALVANLPYNVAVPVVIRVLEEAPAGLLVAGDGPREVGERLAARAGDEAYGAVSVKVAYWATSAVVGRVSASVFIPMPRVESVLVRLDRLPTGTSVRGRPPTSTSSRWCAPDSPTAARCCAARSTAWSAQRRSRPRGSGPRPGPRSFRSGSGSGWPHGRRTRVPHPEEVRARRIGATGERSGRTRSTGPAGTGTEELSAPAKLTLTLQVTGVRSDGYHLLRSEMVSIDLADSLWIGAGRGLTVSTAPAGAGEGPGPGRPAPSATVPVGHDNLVTRALAAVGRTARVDLVKRSRPAPGSAAALPMPPPSFDGRAAGIRRWPPAWARTSPSACPGAGRRWAASARWSPRCPTGSCASRCCSLPFGVDTAAVYRAWDGMAAAGELPPTGSGSNDLEAPALRVEPRLARWRTVFEQATGRRARLAGSGSTWFVEGGPDRSDLGCRQALRLGGEQAQLVSVRTVQPVPRG